MLLGRELRIANAQPWYAPTVGIQRRHPRFPIALTVEVEVVSTNSCRLGTISQVSAGGAFIEIPKPLRPGTQLRVVVGHRDGRRIPMLAEVGYVVPEARSPTGRTGMGIEWQILGQEQKGLIEEILDLGEDEAT